MENETIYTYNKGGKHSALIILSMLLSAGILFMWWTVQRIDFGMREGLLKQIRLMAQAIDPNKINALTGSKADLVNPVYLGLKEKLADIRRATTDCRFRLSHGPKVGWDRFFLRGQ